MQNFYPASAQSEGVVGIRKAALAMYYRLIGKHGIAAEEKAKEAARERVAETLSEKSREAIAAFDRERMVVANTARRTLKLIARANARLS